MMSDYLREMLVESVEEPFQNAIDRAFHEGELKQWLSDKKEYEELKVNAKTEGWQAGYDVGYRVGLSAGKVATSFVDRGGVGNHPLPARYINGTRVPEGEWQRHLGESDDWDDGYAEGKADENARAYFDGIDNDKCKCHHDQANHELENHA